MKKHLVFAVVVFVGCAPPTPTTTTGSSPRVENTPPPIATQATGAPMTLSVVGPDKVTVGDQITLTISVQRNIVNDVPINFSATIPAGASVVAGSTSEQIVDARTPLLTRTIRLRVVRVPAEDVVLTADVRGSGYGAHATAFYRFGRPEPLLPQPTGPSIGLSGGSPRP